MEMHSKENERQQIRTVAARWAKQYPPVTGRMTATGDPNKVLHALLALDVETATAADVAAVIGNDSWVRMPQCIECAKKTTDAMGFSDECSETTTWVCASCMLVALSKLAGRRRSKRHNVALSGGPLGDDAANLP